jgi:acyl-CoA synthetase (AMP-forming)/AMP-acid ligase II
MLCRAPSKARLFIAQTAPIAPFIFRLIASANIARHLAAHAALHPGQVALKIPRRARADHIAYLALDYGELSAEVAAWRRRLAAAGLRPGDRTLVMVRQGLPLIALVFALFELGALPVVIDPGMGREAFLRCVAHSRPRALVGIPLARLLSRVFRTAFRSIELRVPVSGSPFARLTPAGSRRQADDPGAFVRNASDEAAILFTSGSTGAPKGVLYAHGQFDAQVALIRDTYSIIPGEIDLPLLPLFALFNPALGMTTIVPTTDPARPAAADPALLVRAILQENITNSFGSPTLWGKIATHCRANSITLPSIRRVLSAGAPVPPWLWEQLPPLIPNGVLHSPYGATEALPVSTISAPEVLGGTAASTLSGAGTCVGRIIYPNTVKIIAPPAGPLTDLASASELPAGQIGEIIVAGPTVTVAYDGMPEATAAAKIPAPLLYHRLGDLGYLDAAGRLWFCGRRVEAVHTASGPLYTEQVEPIFAPHPGVRRCALVGTGQAGAQRPAIIIEPVSPEWMRTSAACRRFTRELRAIAQGHPGTAQIKTFYFHPKFPVDVRHNAKIHRLALTRWVLTEGIGFESDPKR